MKPSEWGPLHWIMFFGAALAAGGIVIYIYDQRGRRK